MDQEQTFLQAMLEDLRDLALRLIFADWLEERGDPRGELLRLSHLLTRDTDQPNRRQMEERLRSLLEAGVQPVGPFWTNSIGMKFAWIPPGVFLMGSPETELERYENERQHRVRLTKGLWLGVHPVTQEQWLAVMRTNPGGPEGKDLPVDEVSWYDCQAFCAALHPRDGRRYGLPMEAEWEYACRAGTTTPFHFGTVLNGTQANCNGNYPYGTEEKGPSLEQARAVGHYRPNAFGLHDMHGNVWEWCLDSYADSLSASDPDEAPVSLDGGGSIDRVVRGGCATDPAGWCRAAMRCGFAPVDSNYWYGFRVCFRLD
jgi:uncharacterized protein (TIGR02996 family)